MSSSLAGAAASTSGVAAAARSSSLRASRRAVMAPRAALAAPRRRHRSSPFDDVSVQTASGLHRSARRARGAAVVVRATASEDDTERMPTKNKKAQKTEFSNATKMRSEAQAPFRVARMFFFGAFAANASLGLAIASLQAVTKALGAPSAPPLDQSLQNVGVDLACALFFGFWYKRDAEGRDKQMSRISREERLSNLKCELSSGKVVSLYDLRGFSRVVIVAGDAGYCAAAVEAAEKERDALVERGVLMVPLVLSGGDSSSSVPPPTDDDRRFHATPVYTDKWAAWIDEQKGLAKVGDGKGVYVGLRMDGRVRSSGMGTPPWDRFAVELPPTDGAWGGVMDGFDGRVGVDT